VSSVGSGTEIPLFLKDFHWDGSILDAICYHVLDGWFARFFEQNGFPVGTRASSSSGVSGVYR